MPCRGVYFALTDEQENQLLSLVGNDEAVINYIQMEIEEQWDRDWLCETDKAWDAIHRCLTDGRLTYESTTPLHKVVLGGQYLYQGDGYIASFVPVSDLVVIASELVGITESGLREKYFAINEEDYGMKLSEQDWQYTWDYFIGTRDLFLKAHAAERSVIFTVDQ